MSRNRLPDGYQFLDGHKLQKWRRRPNFMIWHHRQFFWCRRFSLIKFSYWSKFHVNIMTSSGVITSFVYKELKSGNQKYPVVNFAQYLETGASWGCQMWHVSLIKSYWMLQIARVTTFTVLQLLLFTIWIFMEIQEVYVFTFWPCRGIDWSS